MPDWEILPGELKKQTVSTGDQRRVFLKIPLAYEAQMLLAPAMAAMQGERDPNYTAAQGVLDVAQTALPGGVPLKDDDLPRTAWRRLVAGMNPILRIPAELWAEENAMTGAPIEGRRVSDRVPFERYTVRTVITNGQSAGDDAYRVLSTTLKQSGASILAVTAGYQVQTSDGITIAVVNPPQLPDH